MKRKPLSQHNLLEMEVDLGFSQISQERAERGLNWKDNKSQMARCSTVLSPLDYIDP